MSNYMEGGGGSQYSSCGGRERERAQGRGGPQGEGREPGLRGEGRGC